MTRVRVHVLQPWLAGIAGLLICATAASAQTPAAPTSRAGSGKTISFGVVGGVTMANMSLPLGVIPGDIDPDLTGVTFSSGTRIGFAGGIYAAFPADGRFAGETGLLISSKGSGVSLDVAGVGSVSGALRLTYLDVPFLARIEAARFSRSTLYILTGPSVGINLGANAKFSALGQSASEPLDGFPTMDYGWVGGARLTFQRLQFEVRYEHGLKNLADDPGVSIKNRTWSTMAGIRF
jgi:hypothetical protein